MSRNTRATRLLLKKARTSSGSVKPKTLALGMISRRVRTPPLSMIGWSSTRRTLGESSDSIGVSINIATSTPNNSDRRKSVATSGIRRPSSQYVMLVRSICSCSASCCWVKPFFILSCRSFSPKDLLIAHSTLFS